MEGSPLQKRLNRYTALATAAAAAPAVQGQVFYTDLNPDSLVTGNFDFAVLDINNDGIQDFTVIAIDTLYSNAPIKGAAFGYYYNTTNSQYFSDNAVMSSGSRVDMLDNGAMVSSGQMWLSGGFMALKLYGYPLYNMPWDMGGTDKFVGVKLELNGGFHYGWVRLDVNPGSDTIIVKDMAVELNEGDPILAGDMTGSMAVIEELKALRRIVHADGSIRVETDPAFGTHGLRVTDIKGQEIWYQEECLAGRTLNIPTSGFSKGVYLVTLIRKDYALAEKLRID